MVFDFASESKVEDMGTIWEYKFTFLPKICCITHETIWFRYAYRGRNYYRTGDITIDYEEKWHRKNEHLVWLLKGI